MASRTTTSLSFQPWTLGQAEEGSLKDILARVSDERGHFRDITEASLQEEIAAEGALAISDSGSEEEDEDDAEQLQSKKAKPTTREELFKAKYEMLAHVRAAEQEILMSLDFVSLLLSKDAPRQAQSTVSPVLKDAVPLGSLGTDIWHRMPVDRAREAQDELLATNIRMEGLQQSADDLISAAGRFETNVRRETQYWNQILTISEEGWNVCRIPGQQHRLGVSFGFSESASEFSRRGLAALNANAEGDVALEKSIATKHKALRVSLRRNGRIVGSSQLPKTLLAEESKLEARIRYARDSLYDEELYHEMIRESRTLASLGVKMASSAIEFSTGTLKDGTQISLDLLSLDEGHGIPHDASAEQDGMAQGIVLAARLLLIQAHREKLKKRSEIPKPMSENSKDERPVMQILRPIMSLVKHSSAIEQLNGYVMRLWRMLDAAHVETSYELASFILPEHAEITTAEALITTLMQPWISKAKLNILDAKSTAIDFSFRIETSLSQGYGSRFILMIPTGTPSYQADDVDDFISAADAKIASGLAKALTETLGNGWRCEENEALLLKDAGINGKAQNMWVSVASWDQTVSLNSPTKSISWEVEGERSEKGFWDAKNELLQM